MTEERDGTQSHLETRGSDLAEAQPHRDQRRLPRIRGVIPDEVLLGFLVLGGFVVARRIVYSRCALEAEAYRSPVIIGEMLSSPVGWLLAGSCALAGWRLRERRIGSIQGRRAVRVVTIACAATMTLAFGFYDFNAWYGQWHTLDRVLLVVLCLLTARTFTCLPAFIVLAVTIVSQFGEPLGLYSWTDKRLIIDLLIVCVVAFVGLPPRRLTIRAIWFAWTVVVGSWYLAAAMGKFRIGWLWHDQLDNLFVSATTTFGWLDLDNSQLMSVADLIASVNPLLRIGVLAIESSVVLLLTRRRIAIVISAGLITLHLGIFAASGIFFWKWIVLHAALIVVLVRKVDEGALAGLYRAKVAVIGALAMLAGSLWGVTELAWYDSPVSTHYKTVAVDCDGRHAMLGPEDLGPYRIIFAQARFGFLTPEATLVDTYGIVDTANQADWLTSASSARDVRDLIDREGVVRADVRMASRFQELLRRFEAEGFERQVPLIGWLSPPHIWGSDGEDLEPLGSLQRLELTLVTTRRASGEPEVVRSIPLEAVQFDAKCSS